MLISCYYDYTINLKEDLKVKIHLYKKSGWFKSHPDRISEKIES